MDDSLLRQDIADELAFEPSLEADGINVTVDDGVATLTGHARSCIERMTAIGIVESVKGIRAVADKIEVRPQGTDVIADVEIARRIAKVFDWNSAIPADRVRAAVAGGHVTLEGEVEWHYQAEAATMAVARLAGVTGVSDHIRTRPALKADDISERIRKALRRDADIDASAIRVLVKGGTVTLEGRVRYLGERRTAERAAWAAPGVTDVVDRLAVR